MALTFTAVENNAQTSGVYENIYTVEFDASYPTGGEAVTAANLGLGTLVELRPGGPIDGYVPEWDSANSKLKVNVASTGAEVGNASSLSTVIFRVEAIGQAAAGK